MSEQMFKRDDIDQMFRDGAVLVIIKPDYAYIELGSVRYYFGGKPEYKEVTLFFGEKVTETILPYDGWERHITGVKGGKND